MIEKLYYTASEVAKMVGVGRTTSYSLIKKMNQEYKLTIFLTSHDIVDIQKLCKRIII